MPFLLLIPRKKKEKRNTIKPLPLNILTQDFSSGFFGKAAINLYFKVSPHTFARLCCCHLDLNICNAFGAGQQDTDDLERGRASAQCQLTFGSYMVWAQRLDVLHAKLCYLAQFKASKLTAADWKCQSRANFINTEE